MISPCSLEGISYSMKSSKIMAQILNEGLNRIGFKYFVRTLGIRIELLLKNNKNAFYVQLVFKNDNNEKRDKFN